MYQEYIFMSESTFNSHGKQFYPNAILVGSYRLAPYVNTEKPDIERYCKENGIPQETLPSASITRGMEEGTLEVALTTIEDVFKVKVHFEPEETYD